MMKIIQMYEELNNLFPKDYHDFIKLIPRCKQFNYNEVALIYKALYKAMELHEGQVKKTGEPYINHPIAVAGILAAYDGRIDVICVPDMKYPEPQFVEKVTKIVDSLDEVIDYLKAQ